jgi:hypothetical protein
MSSNHPSLDQAETAAQPREPTQSVPRTRRPKWGPAAKWKTTTSSSSSKQVKSRMASSSSSAPQSRQSRKRDSSYLSDSDESASVMSRSRAKRPVFTKTGRISKALKGVKVHTCDHCGKVLFIHSFSIFAPYIAAVTQQQPIVTHSNRCHAMESILILHAGVLSS